MTAATWVAAAALLLTLAGCAGTPTILGSGWNDHAGGHDRWKTGGASVSVVYPAVEVQARALAVTGPGRPATQYAGLGVYHRTETDRLGLELGWQGDPLPLFEVREAIHSLTGTDGREVEGTPWGGPHLNFEGRNSWPLRLGGAEVAPYVHTSLGTREISARVGTEVILGPAGVRTTDLSTGAPIVGGGDGLTVFAGGDVGYVAHDALLGRAQPEPIVWRAHAGATIGLGQGSLGISLSWLSPEFEGQPEGQLIGAVHVGYRF